MKVDIIIAVAERGGIENIINSVALYLKNNGWEIRVVQLVWEGVEWLFKEIPFFPLLQGRNGHDLQEFARVYSKFIDENGAPDVVLATAWPYMCYVAKQAAFLSKTEFKTISWLHAPVERYAMAGYGGYDSLEFADVHFAISELIYQGIIQNCKDSLVYRVNNPVDMSVVKCVRNVGKNTHEKQCFFVGRISEEKRLEIIIRALAKVKNSWKLHIIGTGKAAYLNKLHQLAKEQGVFGDIIWYGWKEKPWLYTQNADALIIASEYEGFPLAAIEAQANGIPVISTPVSGITELINPGVNGYVFPFNDYNALAKILGAVGEGILPKIEAAACRNSVKKYNAKNALADLKTKLQECVSHYEMVVKAGSTQEIQDIDVKISIIIPCYNAEKYLRECLDSVINQTFPIAQMEIILINDASTDGTSNIIKEYESRFTEQILVIELEENVGQGAGRNIGMQYMSGKYVMFVDADDKLKENMIQSLFEKAEFYNCEIAECGYTMFSEGGGIRCFEKEDGYFNLLENEELRRYILKWGSYNAPWAKLYKTEFLLENQIFFPEHIFMEDIAFHQICMMTAKKVVMIAEGLYLYRHNLEGIMHSPRHCEYLCDHFKAQEVAYQRLVSEKKLVGFEKEFELLYYVKAFYIPVSEMLSEQGKEWYDEEMIRMIGDTIFEHFPDIAENPYILQDKAELSQRIFRELLEVKRF